jgi:hypothetical protein
MRHTGIVLMSPSFPKTFTQNAISSMREFTIAGMLSGIAFEALGDKYLAVLFSALSSKPTSKSQIEEDSVGRRRRLLQEGPRHDSN